jgi:drug/metabolite transporter (DMT)-like permease
MSKKNIENTEVLSWLLFTGLCLIWGSSFVLMKIGMFDSGGQSLLSAWQVAAMRVFSAGLVLLPFVAQAWKKIPKSLRGNVILSGWLGSFLPAFLFCVAESKIDSALAGTLNAVTPLFTIGIGWLFYKSIISKASFWGILIGFAGCILLFMHKSAAGESENGYSLLVVLATVCYGWNVNMVKEKLSGVGPLDIASLALSGLLPFAGIILMATGYFSLPLMEAPYLKASVAGFILGAVGTAFASVLFYRLVKIAGVIFASLVTYGIPFVAIGWGFIYGEKITLLQVAALCIILSGVYIANRNNVKKLQKQTD